MGDPYAQRKDVRVEPRLEILVWITAGRCRRDGTCQIQTNLQMLHDGALAHEDLQPAGCHCGDAALPASLAIDHHQHELRVGRCLVVICTAAFLPLEDHAARIGAFPVLAFHGESVAGDVLREARRARAGLPAAPGVAEMNCLGGRSLAHGRDDIFILGIPVTIFRGCCCCGGGG